MGEDAILHELKKNPFGSLPQVDSRLSCWEKQFLKAHLLNGQVFNKSSSNKNNHYLRQARNGPEQGK